MMTNKSAQACGNHLETPSSCFYTDGQNCCFWHLLIAWRVSNVWFELEHDVVTTKGYLTGFN